VPVCSLWEGAAVVGFSFESESGGDSVIHRSVERGPFESDMAPSRVRLRPRYPEICVLCPAGCSCWEEGEGTITVRFDDAGRDELWSNIREHRQWRGQGRVIVLLLLLLLCLSFLLYILVRVVSMVSAGLSEAADIQLTLVHSGSSYQISLPPSAPLSLVHQEIESLCGIPVAYQKVVFKGKNLSAHDNNATLQDVGLRQSAKLLVLGSRKEAVEGIQSQEAEFKRRAEILRSRKPISVSIEFPFLP
jgi:hypothetical protein